MATLILLSKQLRLFRRENPFHALNITEKVQKQLSNPVPPKKHKIIAGR